MRPVAGAGAAEGLMAGLHRDDVVVAASADAGGNIVDGAAGGRNVGRAEGSAEERGTAGGGARPVGVADTGSTAKDRQRMGCTPLEDSPLRCELVFAVPKKHSTTTLLKRSTRRPQPCTGILSITTLPNTKSLDTHVFSRCNEAAL